jgi:hypothetical protein
MILVFGIGLISLVKAQTTLVAGDIAFSGYKCNDAVPDQFSFVLLKNIAANTVIRFTDYGWFNDVNAFSNGSSGITESEIVFTATTALTAGQEITIVGTTVTIVNPLSGSGTAVFTVGAQFLAVTNISLASNGDQIFAYQGTFAVPVFIAGIHMNVNTFVNPGDPPTTTAAAWDGLVPVAFRTNNTSAIPPGLATGTNANWFATEQDNVKLLCGSTPVNTIALARSALNSANSTPVNWTSNNTNPSGFTLPSTCPYLQPTAPVKIISFTGKLNSDKTVMLQWKTATQQNINGYNIERSANGIDFINVGQMAVINGNEASYSFIDPQPVIGNNYYRLKTIEQNGQDNYSFVVVVKLKSGVKLTLFPNPVTTMLTIQQFGTIQNKTAVLLNVQGFVLQLVKLNSLEQDVNMKNYPAGIYLLKMEDGMVYKLVKQ